VKASELHKEQPFLKLLVYGDSGTGKTTWASRSPLPFIIATEHQSIPSIAVANPDAEVFLVRDYEAISRIVEAMTKGTVVDVDGQPALQFKGKGSEKYTIQTLVFDSLTDLHTRISEYMRVDEDERKTLKRWGLTQKELGRFLHKLRSLPCNVICTALQQSTGGSDGIPRRTVPALHGQMPERVGQYFSGVGYAHKRSGQYAIAWNLGQQFVTKTLPTLETIPGVTVSKLDTPGCTTLGSLLLSMYPDMDSVPHAEGDSAEHVKQEA